MRSLLSGATVVPFKRQAIEPKPSQDDALASVVELLKQSAAKADSLRALVEGSTQRLDRTEAALGAILNTIKDLKASMLERPTLVDQSGIEASLRETASEVVHLREQVGDERAALNAAKSELARKDAMIGQLRTSLYDEQRKPPQIKRAPKFDVNVTQRDQMGAIVSWEIVPKAGG